jgi:hypothetical protein
MIEDRWIGQRLPGGVTISAGKGIIVVAMPQGRALNVTKYVGLR